MSIVVVKEGMLSTVQDLGRVGYRRFGINPGGVMDQTSVKVLNCLLGNDEDAAVIELHFPAGSYRFEKECVFAIGGADFGSKLNGTPIEVGKVIAVPAGAELTFSHRVMGNRAYLAVAGGFAVDPWLGSASTNLRAELGGNRGRRLRRGDRVEFRSGENHTSLLGAAVGPSLRQAFGSSAEVRVTAGPEFDVLTALSEQKLFEYEFEISPQSDRMGFRLSGEPMYRMDDSEMLSSGVTFGTIQLLPDGQLIVLMADHQTTGGYPRILIVSSVDLPRLAQLGAGDKLSFRMISLPEAEHLGRELGRDIAFLRYGVRAHRQGLL